MPGKKTIHIERLIYSINITDGCWLWKKSTFKDGYGQINIGGFNERAHRVFYETFVGPITNNLQVLHSCDNPLCVKPSHLFLGTSEDNFNDMVQKARGSWSKKPFKKRKITWEQLRTVRKMYLTGSSFRQIEKSTKLHYRNVSALIKYNTGKYLDERRRV